MRDAEVVKFLQWALPRMRMRWAGFRRVRGQVRKRIARRLGQLDLPDLGAYRAHLETEAGEWEHLDAFCRVTISRFYRDRSLWEFLGDAVLPRLVTLARRRGDVELRCLSAGCASGEEPYTLAMVWQWKMGAAAGKLPLRILATDADERLLERARRGVYDESSLRDLPVELRGCFTAEGERFRIDPVHRQPIAFVCQDLRNELPVGEFHLVMLRNSVFTYYDAPLQRALLERLARQVIEDGVLVIGIHEALPPQQTPLFDPDAQPGVHVRGMGE